LRLALGLALLAGLGLGALAWRLGEAPISSPWLIREIEAALNAGPGPTRIEIGDASLRWAGWREGYRSPLEVGLREVRAVEPDGTIRAVLPDAAVSLSLTWLLRGVLAPRALELRGLELRAVRSAAGAFRLDLGSLGAEGGEDGAGGRQGQAVLDILARLMRPPADDTPLAALRRLRLVHARLVVDDAELGGTWSATMTSLFVLRRDGGGLDLQGGGEVALGPERVPVGLLGSVEGATQRGRLAVTLPALRPAALARAAPLLAPLAVIDAPASLTLEAEIAGLAIPSVGSARLRVGEGAVDLGPLGRLAIAGLEAALGFDGEVLQLHEAVLHPAPPPAAAAPPPILRAEAALRPEGAAWRGEARLFLDGLAFADLAHYWPAGLARGAREWMTENITAGMLRGGVFRIAGRMDPATGSITLTAFDGEAAAEAATVHWLRPIPPVEEAAGKARFGTREIVVDLDAGRQSGTGIAIAQGRLRFDFATEPETAEFDFRLGGPLSEVWALLRHPRLRLFAQRPAPIADLGGMLEEARLRIALPLIAELPIERVAISAAGRGTEVRVPRAVLGHDLEGGTLDFTADTEGLRVSGTATLAGIALRLTEEIDFRPGAAAQVVAREIVTARADAQALAALGLDPEPFVRGPIGLEIRSETRRNGQGRVQLRADFTAARLGLEPLAWSKPPGIAAAGEATLQLTGGQLRSIEAIRVTAPDALLRGRASDIRGNQPRRIEIQQAILGRNRFAAELAPPAAPGGTWSIALRGQVIDLVPVLGGQAAEEPASEAAAGAGVDLTLDVQRMLLGPDRALIGVRGSARVDGRGVVRRAELEGRVDGGGAVRLVIAPEGGQRRLRLQSDDGGALLRAFGVLERIEGGRLAVDAAYAHDRPGAPLRGTAELEQFAVREAPALAKLLQAITVFGVVEALDQRGLSFASLTAPFVLTRDALVLEDARAFSVSLGLTARGRIDRRREMIDIEGTIVPAYVFNSLLGRIPLVGRVFSPERGGGLFAVTYRMRGPLADPSVTVNPLAALTPGFLRGIFGLGQDAAPGENPEPRR